MRADSKADIPLPITTSRLSPLRTITPIRPTAHTERTLWQQPASLLNRTFDSKLRTSSTEPTTRRLLARLTELEKLHRADQLRIKDLEEEVKSLSRDLERLKTASQGALNKSADLQTLYHELFLTDMKKQVDAVNREASGFRAQYEESRKELEWLRKESGQQKALLRRYREYVADVHGKQQTLASGTGSVLSIGTIETVESKTPGDRHYSPLKAVHTLKAGVLKLPALEEAVKSLGDAKTLHSLCSILVRTTGKLLPWTTVSLYIVDPVCVDIYRKGKTGQVYHYPLDSKTTLTGHRERDSEPQEPQFRSLSEVSHGLRTRDLMVMPVSQAHRLLLLIQCAENSGNHHGFTQTDETCVSILGGFGALFVHLAEAKDREETHKGHVGRITELCTRLFAARTHQKFANTLRAELPGFLEFEYAGVVFYDKDSQDFFSLPQESGRETSFSSEAIRFPLNIGLTGEVFATKATLIVDLNTKLQRYNPDIDNISNAPEVRNMLLGCLVTPTGVCVGVLHVVNKCGRGKITQLDREKLESLLPLLAGVIANCSEVLACLEVTTNVRKSMRQVQRTVEQADEMRSDMDTSVLLSQIAGIRLIVSELSRKRL